MEPSVTTYLELPEVREEIRRAWLESKPGKRNCHEEGGFLIRDDIGMITVQRWQKGLQDNIIVPEHIGCKIGRYDIVASFHTHPNTGSDYLQEPSETDRISVRDDPNLKGPNYAGEVVIANDDYYLITPSGDSHVLGRTHDLLE